MKNSIFRIKRKPNTYYYQKMEDWLEHGRGCGDTLYVVCFCQFSANIVYEGPPRGMLLPLSSLVHTHVYIPGVF